MAKKLDKIMKDLGLKFILEGNAKFWNKYEKLKNCQRDAVEVADSARSILGALRERSNLQNHIPVMYGSYSSIVRLLVRTDRSAARNDSPCRVPSCSGLVVCKPFSSTHSLEDGTENTIDGHTDMFVAFINSNGECDPRALAPVVSTDSGSSLYVMPLVKTQKEDMAVASDGTRVVGLVDVAIPDAYKTALLSEYDSIERSIKKYGKKQNPKTSVRKKSEKSGGKSTRNRSKNRNTTGTKISTGKR